MSRTANAATDILWGASTPHMHKGTEGQTMCAKKSKLDPADLDHETTGVE
jgi:hypothetical protein